MKVVVGLGNPGQKYSQTRHNIGFMAVEKLAAHWGISALWQNRKNCQIAEYRSSETIILAKPQTYMNLSGQAVGELVDWHKISVDDVIVIYDDVDLPLGKLRLRPKGGSGGHRGVESLICRFGTDAFLRVKIGINHPPDCWDTADYVLSRFTPEENLVLDAALKQSVDAVECILARGIDEAMNKFN